MYFMQDNPVCGNHHANHGSRVIQVCTVEPTVLLTKGASPVEAMGFTDSTYLLHCTFPQGMSGHKYQSVY